MTAFPASFDAARVARAVPPGRAVAALREALLAGLDPEADSPRLFAPAPGGEFLLMPAAAGAYAGVKVATVAPENPAAGLPKIQAVYLLFDAATLAPVAVLDGTELTLVRTAATTALAVSGLLAADTRGARASSGRLVVFGAGPQALRHILALDAVAPAGSVVVVGRRPERVDALLASCRQAGIAAEAGAPEAVADADVVVCCTSSPTPVLDDRLVRAGTVVAAIGAHGLDARELPAGLVRRADVVVESRAGALREGGNLIPARSVEEWRERPPANLAELARGEVVRHADRPAVYSGVGMAWQDLVVATAVVGRPPE